MASAIDDESIIALPEVSVSTDACWLLAAAAAVVSVFTAAKLKHYTVPTVNVVEGNVAVFKLLSTADAVLMPGQGVAPAVMFVVVTVQLPAVVFSV